MLWFPQLLMHLNSHFAVLHYLTLRTLLASLTSLFSTILLGPRFIRWLQKNQAQQFVRKTGPESHHQKQGTPTMGGLLILANILLGLLFWADLSNTYVQTITLGMILFSGIGLVDDLLKIRYKNHKGLSACKKAFAQLVFALLIAWILWFIEPKTLETTLIIPFLKHTQFAIGLWFIPMTVLVIVASSNAVNLTDGLDGLAILPACMICAGLALFAYLSGHSQFAHYLFIPYIPGSGELAVFAACLVGSGLGFLWYNAYPAELFMGDVGSLSIGAVLGILAVTLRQEIAFFIMSGIYVLEAASVILQVGSFKLRGKRIFKMAPIHHHYELKGIAEPKIVIRFWIITLILVLLALMTLKLR
jgi:phospho-N-acetylmuramoyl-pentapeptide-transferase